MLTTILLSWTLSAAAAQEPTVPRNLNSLLLPIMRKHDLPALAGAVVTSGGLIAKGAVGVRRYGKLTPVTVDDQFHLGSDTKAMTATLLALLVEEGKLSWQTTLAQALPGLASGMDPAYRSVTLEQLLAHRAGFTSESWPRGKTFMDMQNLRGSPRRQRWAYSRLILKEPPQAPPGSRYLYSNRSYAIAGVIAEQTEGQPWEKLMRERLFKPLGMETCGFGAMGHPGRTDQPWQHTVASLMHESIAPGKLSDNPVVIAPAGLIHCSVGDWGKFVTAHLRGEKGLPGLLKPETFRKLHSSPYGDYGFGWLLAERPWGGGRVLTHAGSNNSNFAVVWAAPQRDFAVLVMTNQGGDEAAAAADEAAGALMADYLKKP